MYPVDSETIDLFVFATDTSKNKRSLNIQSGPLSESEITLQSNQTIGFSRFRSKDDTWMQDPDFTVHL